MSGLDIPWIGLSLTSVLADLALLGVLYWLLPTTTKTSHMRYVVRFALLWALGVVGIEWALANNSGDSPLRLICEIVSLVAMTVMPALWTQLAWTTVVYLKAHKGMTILDNYQTAVYAVAVGFIGVGFAMRKGYELLPQPFMAVFQVWFMVCLAWSAARFMGPGFGSSPVTERRSRALLAAGASVMLVLVLIDLLDALMLKVHTQLAIGLQFVPMVMMGWAFLAKRKYIIAPAVRKAKGTRTLDQGVRLRPGRLYLELGGQPEGGDLSASDILRSQVRQGRPVMLITNKDPTRYRIVPKLSDLPLVHFVPEGAQGQDLTCEEVLEMAGNLATEFALEAWVQDPSTKKDRGSTVVIEGLSMLYKTAGRKGTEAFLKALRKEVKGSDQLRIVLFGDWASLSGVARTLRRYARPIKIA